jgi:hypothetical protein
VLEAEFVKCKKAHDSREKEGTEDYQKQSIMEINYVIHGYMASDWDEPKRKGKK